MMGRRLEAGAGERVGLPVTVALRYRRGDLMLDELVTRTYPLEALGQAFADMHAGVNAKGVLTFE